MLVSKEFSFDAAHNLVDYQGKCEKLHGHRWKVRVTIKAPVNKNGIAYDFSQLEGMAKKELLASLIIVILMIFSLNPQQRI